MHKKRLLNLSRHITVVVMFAVTLTAVSFAQVSADGRTLVVNGMPPNATALHEARKVEIRYGNSFRFALGAAVTQTPIAAAAVPSLLSPSGSSATKAPAPPPSPGPGPTAKVAATTNLAISSSCAVGQTFDACWTNVRNAIETDQGIVLTLRNDVNAAIRDAAQDQRCYQNALTLYAQPILTEAQATSLSAFALASRPTGCLKQAQPDPWPFAKADAAAASLTNHLQALNDLIDQPDYATWIADPNRKAANSALTQLAQTLLTEAVSFAAGGVQTGANAAVTQTHDQLVAVIDSNKHWRDRLDNFCTSVPGLIVTIDLNSSAEWYGRGRTDKVTLHAVDLNSTSAASQDIQLATNTVLPTSIASTGVGVTFLASPTYAFVPGDNAGTQVIGVTASNNQAPLYASLYNVKLGSPRPALQRGVEFFATAGVGLTTASSTTTADFHGGLSVSLKNRLLFLTPALDFGQRNQLAPGFRLGDAKGSLTAVPTVSHWQPGFMFSISFGIAPSP